jgi:hypothetical protein
MVEVKNDLANLKRRCNQRHCSGTEVSDRRGVERTTWSDQQSGVQSPCLESQAVDVPHIVAHNITNKP